GQTVIAMLIQLGGLGILTFTAFFIYLGGVKSNLKQTMLVKELIQSDHISNVNHYLFQIIITTFVIELIGAVCLYAWWTKFQFDNYSLLFESIFISISAFCNAGFSLHADSFSSQHADSISILMVAFLFIAGSLGIKALTEIRHYLVKYKWQHQNFRFSIQTKIILRATVTLLISGTVLFLISEFNASLSGLSLLAKIKAAFFNSAVSRTSGFNSVNFSSITTVTALWFVAFMFIGGASGSTAGGIKVNTVSVLYLWLRAVLKGEKDCIYEGRSIALGTFHQAILVFTMSTVIVFIFILLLIISEDFSFVDITFEIVSAFATVGVSKGITTDLSSWGKFIVSLTMFIGRIGVVSFALTLMDRQEKVVRVSYPTEGVMIG
ncbi:MAG: hypothetical protein KDD94_14065, partial [Calditrichaeota bacterium]|nr:hypothetical protein [Calditrichota bacterium]